MRTTITMLIHKIHIKEIHDENPYAALFYLTTKKDHEAFFLYYPTIITNPNNLCFEQQKFRAPSNIIDRIKEGNLIANLDIAQNYPLKSIYFIESPHHTLSDLESVALKFFREKIDAKNAQN